MSALETAVMRARDAIVNYHASLNIVPSGSRTLRQKVITHQKLTSMNKNSINYRPAAQHQGSFDTGAPCLSWVVVRPWQVFMITFDQHEAFRLSRQTDRASISACSLS